jgi:hypothetical protein
VLLAEGEGPAGHPGPREAGPARGADGDGAAEGLRPWARRQAGGRGIGLPGVPRRSWRYAEGPGKAQTTSRAASRSGSAGRSRWDVQPGSRFPRAAPTAPPVQRPRVPTRGFSNLPDGRLNPGSSRSSGPGYAPGPGARRTRSRPRPGHWPTPSRPCGRQRFPRRRSRKVGDARQASLASQSARHRACPRLQGQGLAGAEPQLALPGHGPAGLRNRRLLQAPSPAAARSRRAFSQPRAPRIRTSPDAAASTPRASAVLAPPPVTDV